MPLDHQPFKPATIIDNKTVEGFVGGGQVRLDILHGGLPEGTTHVTIRDDGKVTPDGDVILGAHVPARDMPVTVIGKIKP